MLVSSKQGLGHMEGERAASVPYQWVAQLQLGQNLNWNKNVSPYLLCFFTNLLTPHWQMSHGSLDKLGIQLHQVHCIANLLNSLDISTSSPTGCGHPVQVARCTSLIRLVLVLSSLSCPPMMVIFCCSKTQTKPPHAFCLPTLPWSPIKTLALRPPSPSAPPLA